jgi:hypothetical protein
MITAKRVPGWRSALAKILMAAPQKPFSWGDNDCCLGLAVPAVQAVIGVDLGTPYRGQYTTALGAMKALKSQGYDSLVDLAAANFASGNPASARVGDLAAIKAEETGWGLGVVMGSRIGVLAPSGFATIDLLKADHIYKVG